MAFAFFRSLFSFSPSPRPLTAALVLYPSTLNDLLSLLSLLSSQSVLFWEREKKVRLPARAIHTDNTPKDSLTRQARTRLGTRRSHPFSLALAASTRRKGWQKETGRHQAARRRKRGKERFSQHSRRFLPSELTGSLLCCPSPSSLTISPL